MSWDYVCKDCGKEFSTYHPDTTHICYECWRTKYTEEQRQLILPGAIPLPPPSPSQPVINGLYWMERARKAEDKLAEIENVLHIHFDLDRRTLLLTINKILKQ